MTHINQSHFLPTALQKDSPLRDTFNYILAQMQETGVLWKIQHKWTKDNSEHSQCDADQKQRLGYNELLGIFLVLGMGMGLAWAAGLVECAFVGKRARGPRNGVENVEEFGRFSVMRGFDEVIALLDADDMGKARKKMELLRYNIMRQLK